MPIHALPSPSHRRPQVSICDGIALDYGRTHEACGPARRTFALWLAAATTGSVLWISPAWEVDQLNPDGVMNFACPSRFLFLHARRQDDLLWATEEALRAGQVPLVVTDLPAPPGLKPVRRLHLAAQSGGSHGPQPLGLLLTPGNGGAAGIESRWHLSPDHRDQRRQWLLQRLRARTLPPCSWRLHHPAPRAGLEVTQEPLAVVS
jgi:protein ImuA